MEDQIENAILVAFDPRSSQELKAQAFEFFNQLRTDPQGWASCLDMGFRASRFQEVVRIGCLEVVVNAVSTGITGDEGLLYIKDTSLSYLRSAYSSGRPQQEWDSYPIENKIVQLVTGLFIRTYQTTWSSFFQDFEALCSKESDRRAGNHRAVRLYLRTLSAIHDEIGDPLVSRTGHAQKQSNDLKDLIRERDVVQISRFWMDVIPIWHEASRDVFNDCLVVVGKWAAWIDLSLIINEQFLDILVSTILRAAQEDAAEEANPATNAMLEIIGKKMKINDKLHLLDVLKIQEIVVQLSASSRLRDCSSSNYDTDLAEMVARIVNTATFELVLMSDGKDVVHETRSRAHEKIKALLPYLLRYFADDFDEVCSTVIPSLTELLSLVRKRADQTQEWAGALPPILQAIIAKMKYDDTSDWGSDDAGTEEAEFQDLRKRLETLQQTIAGIDEAIYVQTIRTVVLGTFDEFQKQGGQLDWRILDLALHEMFVLGTIAQKNGSLYNRNKPITPAAESLVDMLAQMTNCRVADYGHPAIQLQYMELCVRYSAFFDNNPSLIPQALENFARFIQHDHIKVRQRSWYLFFRFTKTLRPHMGNIARVIVQSIGPLLTIRAEPARQINDDDDQSSNNDQDSDTRFSSQLYLYEAVGSTLSAPGVTLEEQIVFVRAVIEPQFADLESQLPLARSGQDEAITQVHHIIAAFGTLAHGFVDSTPQNVKRSTPTAEQLSAEFGKVAEAILVALDTLKDFVQVRDAARTAFARLLGVLGTKILPQLPRWFSGLLVTTSSKDEIASFLRLLGQVIFALNTDVFSFLNELFSPLLQRVFTGISEPINGTDDEIQLVELKTHYLSLLLVILNQGLSAILVSGENQGMFDPMITSIKHFTRDTEDLLSAKIAFQVLTKMSEVWGGLNIPWDTQAMPQPDLPGFDQFMLENFSALVWALPSDAMFDPRDAKSRQVLQEAAGLHKQILLKTGPVFIKWLRENELKALGMDGETIEQYLSHLTSSDHKSFRQYFLKLAQSIRG